jgi:WD40 repeat protein
MKKVATTKPHPLPAGVTLLHTLSGHKGRIGRIAWSPDGKLLASPSGDGTVRVWDVDTGACRRILHRYGEFLNAVAFSPKGDLLASAGDNSRNRSSFNAPICLWNPATGGLIRQFGAPRTAVNCLAFDRTGQLLASGNEDGSVRLWEVKTGGELQRIGKVIQRHSPENDAVSCVAFDRAGRAIRGARVSGVTYLTDQGSETLQRRRR